MRKTRINLMALAVLVFPGMAGAEERDDLDVMDGGIPEGEAGEERSEPDGAASVNSGEEEVFLLLGFDNNKGVWGRSDALMIVVARYGARELGAISIPRDLWVDVPGAAPSRINVVYRAGALNGGPDAGRDLIKGVIRDQLGVSADHVVAVDFGGFVRIVDQLGGIPVDVPCAIEDRFLDPTAEGGRVPLSLPAGRSVLDGRTALLYSRSRHGRSDWDRASRQQALLMGLRERAMSFGVVPRIPALWEEIRKDLKTDIDARSAFRLARLALTLRRDKLHGIVLREPEVAEWRTPDGKQVLVADKDMVARRLKGLFSGPRPGTRRGVCQPPDAALRWREPR
ncbi:MAG: LCP family protein [Deltaproteobacteria bacterium]|nr:LCP family protein [Deltaproteobacteria bacterium]